MGEVLGLIVPRKDGSVVDDMLGEVVAEDIGLENFRNDGAGVARKEGRKERPTEGLDDFDVAITVI